MKVPSAQRTPAYSVFARATICSYKQKLERFGLYGLDEQTLRTRYANFTVRQLNTWIKNGRLGLPPATAQTILERVQLENPSIPIQVGLPSTNTTEQTNQAVAARMLSELSNSSAAVNKQ